LFSISRSRSLAQNPLVVSTFDSLLREHDKQHYDEKNGQPSQCLARSCRSSDLHPRCAGRLAGIWCSFDRVGFMPPKSVFQTDTCFLHWDQNPLRCSTFMGLQGRRWLPLSFPFAVVSCGWVQLNVPLSCSALAAQQAFTDLTLSLPSGAGVLTLSDNFPASDRDTRKERTAGDTRTVGVCAYAGV
jgi:hypothetical protein